MKLGLIARADNTGLGNQTWEFYKHMKPYRTMVVDISDMNNNHQYPERYTEGEIMPIKGFPNNGDIREFLTGLDVVFLAEAPYNFALYSIAKDMGVKVANQYNYEFFDWFVHPDWPTPDMLIAPSRWNYDKIQAFCDERGIEHVYLHCPVNREVIPERTITQAKVFLHNAGRSAAYDRNGTETVIHAAQHVKSDVRILIHFQGEQGLAHQATRSIADYIELRDALGVTNIQFVKTEYENYQEAYEVGDVMLLPRRYGGNCLPLNEALSAGMPVIMPDISPNNALLPADWLVPAEKVGEFTPRTAVDIYGVNPIALAHKIDYFAGLNSGLMRFANIEAGKIAQSISWKALEGEYKRILEALCTR